MHIRTNILFSKNLYTVMKMNKALLLFAAVGTVILLYGVKKLKMRYILLSALSGIAAFVAVDYIGGYIGINLPMNVFSLSVSSVMGIPGVILLTIVQSFI